MPSYGMVQSDLYPAPQTSVVVLSPVGGKKTRRIDALLDTGAECTCVPAADIERLGACLDYNYIDCIGPVGQGQMTAYTVHLRIGYLGDDFEDIEVIATSRPYALIGRDILNQFRLVFDGPHEVWRRI
jgi:hypothetical protein